MKNRKVIQLFHYSVILLFAACTNNNTTIIEGTLPNNEYNQQVVYWVPFEQDGVQSIDSTGIRNNKFRLLISPNNHDKMGIIRMNPQYHPAIQPLLVFAEKGITQVTLDSLSSATGTPLNDVMQNFKDIKEKYNKELYAFHEKRKTVTAAEEIEMTEEFKKVAIAYRDDVYQIILENAGNGIGKILFSLHKPIFTPDEFDVLNNAIIENEK